MKKLIIILIAFFSIGAVSQDTVSVYFVGNSYTLFNNGLNNSFANIVNFNDTTVLTGMRAVTGSHLYEHWNDYYTPSYIAGGDYDYVSIQDHSQTYVDEAWVDSFNLYTQKFDSVIKANGGQTLLFMTWRKEDSTANWTDTIAKLYTDAGTLLNSRVVPAGLAWQLSIDTDPSVPLYIADGSHPTAQGTYLNTCMFYASIFNRSPIGLGNAGLTVSGSEALYLQQIAWQTYIDFYEPEYCDTVHPLVLDADIVNETYIGNGTIDITVSYGTEPYSYSWSNGETTEDISNINSGAYVISVTDNNFCTAIDSFTVSRDYLRKLELTKTVCDTLLQY